MGVSTGTGTGRGFFFLVSKGMFFTIVWRASGKFFVARIAIQGQDICAFDFVEPFFNFQL